MMKALSEWMEPTQTGRTPLELERAADKIAMRFVPEKDLMEIERSNIWGIETLAAYGDVDCAPGPGAGSG